MDKFLIVFHNCQGLGLQGEKSLVRIPSDLYQIYLKANTIYLVNKDGDFLCTLLKERENYESADNHDRRIQNLSNGFKISWDNDQNKCDVFYDDHSLKRKKQKRILRSFSLYIVAFGLGIFLSYLILDESSHVDALESQVYSLNSQNARLKNEVDELNILIEPYRQQIHLDSIKNSSNEMRKTLHSLDCNAHTVSEVREWWNSLSQSEKSATLDIYDFDLALTLYSQLFNSRDLFDLSYLIRNKRRVFSNEQLRILKMSERCRRNGAKFIQLHSMNFREIESALKDYMIKY